MNKIHRQNGGNIGRIYVPEAWKWCGNENAFPPSSAKCIVLLVLSIWCFGGNIGEMKMRFHRPPTTPLPRCSPDVSPMYFFDFPTCKYMIHNTLQKWHSKFDVVLVNPIKKTASIVQKAQIVKISHTGVFCTTVGEAWKWMFSAPTNLPKIGIM